MGKIIKSAAMLVVGLCMFAGTASAAWTTKVYAELNIRSGPSTRYAVIDSISYGDRVRVHGCKRSWCRVSYHGTRGWASRRFLKGHKKVAKKRYRKRYNHGHSHYRGPIIPFHPFFRPRIRSGFGFVFSF
jgi:uncharacterized protein YraI